MTDITTASTAAHRVAALIRAADGSAADSVEEILEILREAGLEVDKPTAGDMLDAVTADTVTWTPAPEAVPEVAYTRGWMIGGRSANRDETARLAELLGYGSIAIEPHDADAVQVPVTAVAGKAGAVRHAVEQATAAGATLVVDEGKRPPVDDIPDGVDLDMLAEDIADMLGDRGYDDLQLCADSIRPFLPAFVGAALARPVPFVSDGVARPGYVAGHCGHAVAMSEWLAGFRNCERCGR